MSDKIKLRVDLTSKEDISNKSSSISTDTGSTTKYPTVKAVEDYVSIQVNENYGTFAELQTLINNAQSGDVITLEKDYKNSGDEAGISITKPLKIIGNGHIIDGNNNRIISASNNASATILEDLTFINADDWGSVVQYCNELTINKCIFVNNKASGDGGAIYVQRNHKIIITDSTFINNSLYNDGWETYGGAIYLGDNVTGFIKNCTFANNESLGDTGYDGKGGAIFVCENVSNKIIDCNFINNTATSGGGIHSLTTDFKVYGCKFENSTLYNTTNVDYLTEHQNISGKEDTNNKVASWSNTPSDVTYPSEKLVKDSIDAQKEYYTTKTITKTINFSEPIVTQNTRKVYDGLCGNWEVDVDITSMDDGDEFFLKSAINTNNKIRFVKDGSSLTLLDDSNNEIKSYHYFNGYTGYDSLNFPENNCKVKVKNNTNLTDPSGYGYPITTIESYEGDQLYGKITVYGEFQFTAFFTEGSPNITASLKSTYDEPNIYVDVPIEWEVYKYDDDGYDGLYPSSSERFEEGDVFEIDITFDQNEDIFQTDFHNYGLQYSNGNIYLVAGRYSSFTSIATVKTNQNSCKVRIYKKLDCVFIQYEDYWFVEQYPSDYYGIGITNDYGSSDFAMDVHWHKQILNTLVRKSSREGLLRNDGTVDTTSYSTFNGNYNDLSNKPTIPTKTSDLTNDSNFLTSHQDISGKLDKIQTSYKGKNVVVDSTSGNITFEDKPTIPSKTSDLTNDSNFLTSHQSLDSKTVTVEEQSQAETGFTKTYIIKQGGVQVGNKINIPKDFLVKSASVKTVSTANNPVQGYLIGDKYLDFVVNSKDNTATDEHLYVLVSELVDTEIDWANVQNKPTIPTDVSDLTDTTNKQFTPKSHTHTKSQVTDFAHNHNDLYYTETEVDTLLGGKSDTNHTHSGYLTSHQDVSNKEDKSNKVISLSSSSTDTQYPSAKAVYDAIQLVDGGGSGLDVDDFYIDTTTDEIVIVTGNSGGSGGGSNVTIADNLTTNDSTQVLSARQGKILNDKIGDILTFFNGSGN